MSHPHSDAHLPRQKNLKRTFSSVTGGYLQKHSLAFRVCVCAHLCVLSDCRRLWSVHRHSGMGCRVSSEWQTDRLTASRGCLWRIPTEEVSLSELSGTVMCIRLCKRPLQRHRVGGGVFVLFFFFSFGG